MSDEENIILHNRNGSKGLQTHVVLSNVNSYSNRTKYK